MNRRDLLERLLLTLGSAALASGTAAAPATSSAAASSADTTPPPWTPRSLTPAQNELVATLAELIIPTTDTPGGRAARVNEFIDIILTDIYTADERRRFVAGLTDLDRRASMHGASFVGCTSSVQMHVLTELERESAWSASGESDYSFFPDLKELSLIGYYRSKIGASQELRYGGIQGLYEGDVSLESIGRSWYGRGGTD